MTFRRGLLGGAISFAIACGGSHQGATRDTEVDAGSSGAGGQSVPSGSGGGRLQAGAGGVRGGAGGQGALSKAGQRAQGGAASGGAGAVGAAGRAGGAPDAGTAGGGMAGSGVAGGASGNDGSGSEAGAAGVADIVRGSGSVELRTYLDFSGPGTASFTTVGAAFVSADASGAQSCAPTVVGACSLYLCQSTDETNHPDAGRITARSDAASFDAAIVPDPMGRYLDSSNEFEFQGGEDVSFSAEGNEVPPFSDEIDYPNLLVLTAPPVPGGQLTASRVEDLTLTWDGGVPGVRLSVQISFANGYLGCTPDSGVGTLTIPATMLGQIPYPDRPLVELSTSTSHKLKDGAFDVTIWALGDVLSPEGDPVIGQVE